VRQSRSEQGDEEKKSESLPGLVYPIIQPVAQRYTTELSRLLYVCVYVYIYIFFFNWLLQPLSDLGLP
jgi:hypothetical protein